MSEVNTPICGREHDLIGHLYGELNEVEARSFQNHLNQCAACRTELASLGMVRESVVNWRNESIGNIGLPVQATTSSPTMAQAGPSAMAALREFFSLAPLWMKGALAFAAVLFFVFGGLALARLSSPPPVAVVNPAGATAPSSEQINALVNQRVQEELIRIKSDEQKSKDLLANDKTPQKNPLKPTGNRGVAAPANYSQSARRPLSKSEREQLAADLRLVSLKSDGDMELLEDRINQ